MPAGQDAMKVLLFSSLYPSSVRPGHGIFVETRLRELLKSNEVQAKVVAPVPWFPSSDPRFGGYAKFAATPRHEVRHGIEVFHPRYLLAPRIGMNVAPWTMAVACWPLLKRLQRSGFDFDLIDAHYAYPDGVAAGLLAKWVGKPFMVTSRGSDINVIARHHDLPRRLILNTAARAGAVVGVSQALVDAMCELGVPPARLRILRNGVDLERFSPEPRTTSRQRLGLAVDGTLLISVGNLVELKGHHIAIEALALLPHWRLVIVGAGPEEARLKALAGRLGVSDRLHWAGSVPQEELKWWYSAADALVLCSSREGWPNVLLEAMASGTPVIATPVGGIPEVVTTREAGVLMLRREPESLVQALHDLMSAPPSNEQVRRYAEGFSWEETSRGQLEIMRRLAPRDVGIGTSAASWM